MPGGVAGERSATLTAPMPICAVYVRNCIPVINTLFGNVRLRAHSRYDATTFGSTCLFHQDHCTIRQREQYDEERRQDGDLQARFVHVTSLLNYVAGMLSVVMLFVVDYHHVTNDPPSLMVLTYSTTAAAPPARITVRTTLNRDLLNK
jgi:hypothetical protein